MHRTLACALVVALVGVACGGGGEEKCDVAPKEVSAQVEVLGGALMRMAATVRANPGMLGFMRTPRLVIQAARRAFHYEKYGARVKEMMASAIKELGFNPFEEKAWEETGLDLDAPVMMVLQPKPVLVFRVKDKGALLRKLPVLVGKPLTSLTIEGAEDAEAWSVPSLGVMRRQGGYYYLGSDPVDIEAVCRVCNGFGGLPMSDDRGFHAYLQEGGGDQALFGGYNSTRGEVASRALGEFIREIGMRRYRSPIDGARVLRRLSSFEGFGFSVLLEENAPVVRMWAGTQGGQAQELKQALRAPQGTPEVPAGMLEGAIGVLKVSYAPVFGYDRAVDLMSRRGLEEFMRASDRFRSRTKLAMRDDLVEAMSGRMVVFGYANPQGRLSPVIMVHFKDSFDTRKLDPVIAQVISVNNQQLKRETIKVEGGSVEVIRGTGRAAERGLVLFHEGWMVMADARLGAEALAARLVKKGDGGAFGAKVAGHQGFGYLDIEALEEIEPRALRGIDDEIEPFVPAKLEVAWIESKRGVMMESRGWSVRFLESLVGEGYEDRKLQKTRLKMHSELRRFAYSAKGYFTTEQKYSASDGDQPWHRASSPAKSSTATSQPGGRRRAGLPIVWADYVFPGGANADLTIGAAPPKLGETVEATLPGSAMEKATVRMLEVVEGRELMGQLRYTTGPGTGQKATATLVYRAKLASGKMLTMTITMYVDPKTQEVLINPPVVVEK